MSRFDVYSSSPHTAPGMDQSFGLTVAGGFRIPGREADMVLIAPDTTRADLILCAQHLTDRARLLSRQGKRGMESAAYRRLHEDIDAVLDAIEAAG